MHYYHCTTILLCEHDRSDSKSWYFLFFKNATSFLFFSIFFHFFILHVFKRSCLMLFQNKKGCFHFIFYLHQACKSIARYLVQDTIQMREWWKCASWNENNCVCFWPRHFACCWSKFCMVFLFAEGLYLFCLFFNCSNGNTELAFLFWKLENWMLPVE